MTQTFLSFAKSNHQRGNLAPSVYKTCSPTWAASGVFVSVWSNGLMTALHGKDENLIHQPASASGNLCTVPFMVSSLVCTCTRAFILSPCFVSMSWECLSWLFVRVVTAVRRGMRSKLLLSVLIMTASVPESTMIRVWNRRPHSPIWTSHKHTCIYAARMYMHILIRICSGIRLYLTLTLEPQTPFQTHNFDSWRSSNAHVDRPPTLRMYVAAAERFSDGFFVPSPAS